MLLVSADAFAARGWFGRACDALLFSREAEVTPPAAILKIETEMQNELYRINRRGPNGLKISHTPLDFCSNRPLSVEVLPQLSPDYEAVRRVDMRLFVHPDAIGLEWKDQDQDLSVGPSLVLMFDEVPVRTSSGEVSLEKLVRDEFQSILSRNPEIRAQMKVGSAAELESIRIRPEYKSHKIVWIEGDLPNFQIKRMMALMTDYAFGQAMMDQRYAMRKPEKPPTKH